MTEMEDRLAKLFDEKFKSLFNQLEAVATMKTQISELDAKLTDQAGRIEQVQAKVDLTMTSVANLQQEQLQVARALKTAAPPKLQIPGRDGARLMGAHPMYPPPPAPQYLSSQVVFPPSPAATDPHVSSSDPSALPGAGSLVPLGTHRIHDVGVEDLVPKRVWLPKMDFPVFEGSDVRIWLDKCKAYFSLF